MVHGHTEMNRLVFGVSQFLSEAVLIIPDWGSCMPKLSISII